MKSVSFHPEADAEVTEATRYYEMRSPGLGLLFLMEIQRSEEQIIANPEAISSLAKKYAESLSDDSLTASCTPSNPIGSGSSQSPITNAALITGFTGSEKSQDS